MNRRKHPFTFAVAFICLPDIEAFRGADSLLESGVFHGQEINFAVGTGQRGVLFCLDFTGFIGTVIATQQAEIASRNKLRHPVGGGMFRLFDGGFFTPPLSLRSLTFVMTELFHRLGIEPATFCCNIHRPLCQ